MYSEIRNQMESRDQFHSPAALPLALGIVGKKESHMNDGDRLQVF
jgi:hypothetical protein